MGVSVTSTQIMMSASTLSYFLMIMPKTSVLADLLLRSVDLSYLGRSVSASRGIHPNGAQRFVPGVSWDIPPS